MSGLIGVARIAEEAVTTAAETLIQLVAPSNHRLKILEWGVFFDGTSATDAPIIVDILRQSTAGTSASLTLVKWNDSDDETLQATALQDFSAEPTAGDILESKEVHPQSGYEKIYPLGQELIVKGGGRIGLRVTAGANVNALAYIKYEE